MLVILEVTRVGSVQDLCLLSLHVHVAYLTVASCSWPTRWTITKSCVVSSNNVHTSRVYVLAHCTCNIEAVWTWWHLRNWGVVMTCSGRHYVGVHKIAAFFSHRCARTQAATLTWLAYYDLHVGMLQICKLRWNLYLRSCTAMTWKTLSLNHRNLCTPTRRPQYGRKVR